MLGKVVRRVRANTGLEREQKRHIARLTSGGEAGGDEAGANPRPLFPKPRRKTGRRVGKGRVNNP